MTALLLRLDLVRVEPSRNGLDLPVWAPAPLIDSVFSELVEQASSLGQIYDAADTTNNALWKLPMRIQAVDVLTYRGLPPGDFQWIKPEVQLLFPAVGSSRREVSWDSVYFAYFERIARLSVPFPEKLAPAK
jgi:hypothetical protein